MHPTGTESVRILSDLKEIWRYRELALTLAAREVRVRFKHTLLGFGWAIAMPLSLMLVFTFVFARVASVQTGGVPYALFALIGLVPWQLHANIINGAARSLSDNSNLVTKVYFAREVLPLSVVLSALLDFAIASTLVAALMAHYRVLPGASIVFLPLVFAVQLCLGVALALLLSALNLLYRDVQFILQVGLTLWMFASSTIYPIPHSGSMAWLAWVNPMTPILDGYRAALLGGELPPALSVAAGVSALLLVVCWRWFRRVERLFGELA